MQRAIAFALFGAALAQAVAAPASAAANKARGEFFAREHCGICHAVGRTGASPYPRAPAFRTLPQKYDVEGLAEALAEGIVVSDTGERQMPEFVLSPEEIGDLIAYLKSLAPGKTASPQPARESPRKPIHSR
jgi:mono/diheme cytochrome c family protein